VGYKKFIKDVEDKFIQTDPTPPESKQVNQQKDCENCRGIQNNEEIIKKNKSYLK